MKLLIAILLALFVTLQWQLWFGHGGMRAVWELQRSRDRQLEENRQLEERNQSLEAEVEDLKGGLEAVEERARSEMGMIKEGEIFYQTIDGAQAGAPGPGDTNP